jgi:hypothetical protein
MNKLKKKSQQNNSGTTVQEKTQKKKQDNPFNIYKTQTINNGVASVFIGIRSYFLPILTMATKKLIVIDRRQDTADRM